MDYIAFCKNYYAATRIPISLLQGNKPVYSSVSSMLSMPTYRIHDIDTSGLDLPCLNNYDPDIEYGMVEIKGTDMLIILGPNFGIHPTEELISEYMRELLIPSQEREVVGEFLNTIPQLSTLQFVRHLILAHQCVNQETVSLAHFFGEGYSEKEEKATREILRPEYEKEETETHSTYVYELDLYERVRKGNAEELKQHLDAVPLNLNTSTLGPTPLRQTKNLFVKTITNVVMIGAIPGGVPVDMAYALMDSYVQEAERLTSVREIEILCYNMLLEFCRLAGKNKIPKGLSSDVFTAMSYIRGHVDSAISVQDVADATHRSPSFITQQFRKELGITPGAFISRCKLEEAKSLLLFSDKSLAEISSHLCYSSQGYFQNVFKKKFGMTPLQYRNTKRRIE